MVLGRSLLSQNKTQTPSSVVMIIHKRFRFLFFRGFLQDPRSLLYSVDNPIRGKKYPWVITTAPRGPKATKWPKVSPWHIFWCADEVSGKSHKMPPSSLHIFLVHPKCAGGFLCTWYSVFHYHFTNMFCSRMCFITAFSNNASLMMYRLQYLWHSNDLLEEVPYQSQR